MAYGLLPGMPTVGFWSGTKEKTEELAANIPGVWGWCDDCGNEREMPDVAYCHLCGDPIDYCMGHGDETCDCIDRRGYFIR